MEHGSDFALWRKTARMIRERSPSPHPDPLVLAAWLDGRSSAEDAAAIEAWIASDPHAASELLASLRETLAHPTEPAPGSLVLRLRALRRRTPPRHLRVQAPLRRGAAWAAMLLLALVSGGGGLLAGIEAGLMLSAVSAELSDAGLEPLSVALDPLLLPE